jgi:hypothetical protein
MSQGCSWNSRICRSSVADSTILCDQHDHRRARAREGEIRHGLETALGSESEPNRGLWQGTVSCREVLQPKSRQAIGEFPRGAELRTY